MHAQWRNRIVIFVTLSLLIHICVWTGLRLAKVPKISSKKEQIEIVVLDQSQSAQKKLQIVEQNQKSLNDEIPEDTKYLSAHNQRVVKETQAKDHGDFRNTPNKGGEFKKQNQIAKKSSQRTQDRRGSLPTLADLKPQFDPSLSREINQNAVSDGPASQTNDHLKETHQSLETLLNTREFVYFSYYQRIRTQIRQYWEPSIRGKVKKILAQGRNIASERDHITRVIIVLDKTGSLMGVKVVGESGLKDLDDAAVEAFRAAEPFPNPPKGIVEQDGTIKINWDFILEA